MGYETDGGIARQNQRPNLETVINSGIRVFLFDGDADYICGYFGFEAMVNALATPPTQSISGATLKAWTVAGKPAGLYKQASNFTYLRVYGAGHEVPAYSANGLAIGQAAASFFKQVMAPGGVFGST